MQNRVLYTDREAFAVAVVNALRRAGVTCHVVTTQEHVDYGSTTDPDDVGWSTVRCVSRHHIIVPDADEQTEIKNMRRRVKTTLNTARPQAEIDSEWLTHYATVAGKGTRQTEIITPEARCPDLPRVPASD